MPVLTPEQVFEAVMELETSEREELERIEEQRAFSLELSEEHKGIIRQEIEEHRRDPSTAVSRGELMAKMRAAL